jgi:hypothetical protein
MKHPRPTPRIDAIRVGRLLPAPPWRSVAAFDSALSFVAGDGGAVSVVRDSPPGTRGEGRAIEIPPTGFDELRRALQGSIANGARATAAPIGIAIVDARGGIELASIDLRRATIRDPRPELRLLSSIWKCFTDDEKYGRIASLSAAFRSLRKEGGACRSTSWSASFESLPRRNDWPSCLAGWGPGTTPAGDDMLAGMLIASALRAEGPFGPIDATRTTPPGASLLRCAIAGDFPDYLLAVAGALCADDCAAALPSALRAALSHGASSGADAIEGLLLGIGAAG